MFPIFSLWFEVEECANMELQGLLALLSKAVEL